MDATSLDDHVLTLGAMHRLTSLIRSAPWWAFAALTSLYIVAVCALSSLKLLWLDELITLHIARLDSIGAIWHALALGADPNPPVTHILVHYSRLLFGEHELALRLPAIVGYWIGMLSLFVYLRRRIPAEWALAGTVLSMTMAAFDYSFESRSYAIFYGLAMLSFLCWSVYIDESRAQGAQIGALLAMAVVLSLGISTNYFAVLAFFPIAAGECARTFARTSEDPNSFGTRSVNVLRMLDYKVWIALAVAGSSLIAYLPIINQAIAQFAPHAWNKVSLDQVFDSYTQMVETILYPLLGLFSLAIIVLVAKSLRIACPTSSVLNWLRNSDHAWTVPRHEAIGIFFFMLYPFLGYAVSWLHAGMLSPRFVIPVCFGFAIAGIIVAHQLFGHLRLAGTVTLLFLTAWFAARESVVGYSYAEQKQSFYKVVDRLPLAFNGLPQDTALAVPDPLMALTFQHYAPSAYANRVVFPVDFPAIRKFRNEDSPEENLWVGHSLYSLRIEPLATFQSTVGKYVVLASDWNWLLQDLDRHRYLEHRLPINTRAGAIGGFTPLSHGLPAFYVADGSKVATGPLEPGSLPIPFKKADNLPEAADLP